MIKHDDIGRILLLATHDLAAARRAFEETFGLSPEEVIDADHDRLTLALFLRKGKRGRLPVAKHIKRGDPFVMEQALKRKKELRAAGKSVIDAEHDASEEVAAGDKRTRPLSAAQIRDAFRHGGKTDR